MHLLRMEGSWGSLSAWLYSRVVADGAQELHRQFVDEIVGALPPSGLVVDLGCGEGRVAGLLAERCPEAEVLGLDLSPAMVRRARRRETRPNLSFLQGDAMALPFLPGSVDLLTCVASIKHWPDRQRGLAQVARVLRPGGALCILEADRACSPDAARRFAGYWRYLLPGTAGLAARYFRRVVAGQALDLEQLEQLVRGAGLVQLQTRQLRELPFVAVQARAAG